MTKAEVERIVEELVEELRELTDGTEITSRQLLERAGCDLKELSEDELFDCHEALCQAAEDARISLDMSKHEGIQEGLPWDLDFVVRNDEAQIECPYCGSRNTARIFYGMPLFTKELQDKLDAGRVVLGGCCLTGAETEDGEWVSVDPTHHCNNCKKDFGGLQKKK